MNNLEVSLVAFGLIVAGGLLGLWVKSRISDHLLGGDTKDIVR
jgi:hypothetical protein